MKEIKKILILSIMIFASSPVLANLSFPEFPMAFYGTATLNGENIEKDSKVQAYCDGVLIGEVKLTENGIYGYENSSKTKLLASECSNNVLFKYIPKGSTNALNGAVQIKYTDIFESGKVLNKNLNFITSQSCNISNGTGKQSWVNDTSWESCVVISCNSGYTQNGNSCTITPSSGGGGGGGSYTPIVNTPPVINTNVATPEVKPITEIPKSTEEKRVIPGCDNRITGFSILTGESCLNNKVDIAEVSKPGIVLGAETQNYYKFTLLLKRGSRNNEVKELQSRLNSIGNDSGKPDGVFGAKTQKAVIDFQKNNKLKADGIVGKNTRDILNK